MQSRRRWLPFSLGLLLLATPVAATTYHVAPWGSDSNPGTESQPWETLQEAAGNASAGDIVLVQDGTYEPFHITRSGQPGDPITFKSVHHLGATIDGSESYGGRMASVHVTGDYVVFDGFRVRPPGESGVYERGIRASGESSDPIRGLVIRNCEVSGAGMIGIGVSFGDGAVVEYNHVFGSIASHGMYLANSSDDAIFRGNVVHDCYKAGLHMNGDASQGGDGVISRTLIEGNIFYRNAASGTATINMDGAQDTIVRNNLLYDNYGQGITSFRWDGAEPSRNNKIINNTIVQPSGASSCIRFVDGATNGYVRNNISIHLGGGYSIYVEAGSESGLDSDYNILSSYDSWRDDNPDQDGHSYDAPPLSELFLGPASADYHLAPGSLAVDNGIGLADVPWDLDGTPRPQGSGFDIGAYERSTGSGDPPGAPTNLRRIDKK